MSESIQIGDFTITRERWGMWSVTGGDIPKGEDIVFTNKYTAYSWVNLHYNCSILVSQGVQAMLEMMIKESK